MIQIPFKAGHVALVGKPNVGKSTLLNTILGVKVSIVSNKPQTTRKSVLGIANGPEYQIAFLDTPGIHAPHTVLGKAMVESARTALASADVLVVVGDVSHHPGEQDKALAEMIANAGVDSVVPRLLCLNKMDLLKAEDVQRNVDGFCQMFGTEYYMLTIARTGQNVQKLVAMIVERLPNRAPIYPEGTTTDQTPRFQTAELVREKILQATRNEVPHATAVRVDEWEDAGEVLRIQATILVEKASQRGIVIGRQGAFLKQVGIDARREIEAVLRRHVYLELHVKVAEDWRMNPRLLHELEYEY